MSPFLKQRIYTKRLPASFNLLDRSIDHTEKLLAQTVLDGDKRSTLADRRQKAIAHFKYELMAIQIATAEETRSKPCHGDCQREGEVNRWTSTLVEVSGRCIQCYCCTSNGISLNVLNWWPSTSCLFSTTLRRSWTRLEPSEQCINNSQPYSPFITDRGSRFFSLVSTTGLLSQWSKIHSRVSKPFLSFTDRYDYYSGTSEARQMF